MTSRERMLVAMRNGIPDSVPVAPDISNMIPCRLTGKPFWDIYLYSDPPLWKAYIEAVKHFGFDGWLPDAPVQFDFERQDASRSPGWQEAIVRRGPKRITTRHHAEVDGRLQWTPWCTVYYDDNPPTGGLPLEKVGLPEEPPSEWEDVHRRQVYDGRQGYDEAKRLMGERGIVGVAIGLPGLDVRNPDSIYEYYDHRERVVARCEEARQNIVRRAKACADLKPDFVLIGISGHMISNPEPIFRELSLPTLKDITSILKAADVPTQIHCCGPEKDLVRISALETDLSNINPLEIPPMGDCDLRQIKAAFGRKLSLMGNLHTTEVMLRGSVHDVERAAKKAIDDAGEAGGFILSTGDQCGRDTPEANLFAMIEVARTYGRY